MAGCRNGFTGVLLLFLPIYTCAAENGRRKLFEKQKSRRKKEGSRFKIKTQDTNNNVQKNMGRIKERDDNLINKEYKFKKYYPLSIQ
jgi:hypothetical protein